MVKNYTEGIGKSTMMKYIRDLFEAHRNHQCRSLHKKSILSMSNRTKHIYLTFLFITQHAPRIFKRLTDLPVCFEPGYFDWLLCNYPRSKDLRQMRTLSENFSNPPKISIITPVFNPPIHFLKEAIESVLTQSYPYWELCLVDDGSTSPKVKEALDQYSSMDSRIKIQYRSKNGGIVAASNTGLEMATGEFVAQLDHDDLLTPDALYEVAAVINKQPDVDMIYSDEDKIDEKNRLSGPFFKPDWCPDSFLSRMYPCHLGVYRRSLLKKIKGFRKEYEGGQTYDLVLRLTEETQNIYHIPKILYHWRMHSNSTALDASLKPYVYEADQRALQAAVDRRDEPGVVKKLSGYQGYYIVRYQIQKYDKVSIIIPTRNQGHVLDNCLSSIFKKTIYPDFEVIIVDNGTTEKKALQVLSLWLEKEPDRVKCYPLNIPFNFSLLCNFGVEKSQGDYLLFLNNDTEIITNDWIDCMLEQAQRPTIGMVGVQLLYPDETIQHAGAILGLGGVAAHSHRGHSSKNPGYMGQVISMNNYLSVAATCSMCRREVFEKTGGFDPKLPGDYEDVDLCLKMVEKGYNNIYLPHVKLYHHESKSRGKDYALKDPEQQNHTVQYVTSKWKKYIDYDPCYSPNLTREDENYSIRTELGFQMEVPTTYFDSRDRRVLKFTYCIIDSIRIYDHYHISLEGWAMKKDGKKVVGISLIGENEEDETVHLGIPRPDVLEAYPKLKNSKSGYVLKKTLSTPIRKLKRIKFQLTTEDGIKETFSLKLRIKKGMVVI